MSSTFRKILVCLIAIFAVSAIAATAAMAETGPEQQFFTNGKCIEPNGVAEWWYTETKCETVSPTKVGKWELEEPTLKGFTSKEGVSTLAVSTATVTCQKDTNVGKIDAGWKESVEKVVVTFSECKGKKGTEACPVKSTNTTVAEQIKTNSLKGELGETTESSTNVGLLLEGESSNVFVTLAGTCLPAGGGAVEGSVVGEVTPLTLGLTDKTEFLVSAGVQKIKTFQRSLAKHCAGAPAARKCEADFSFTSSLKAFGTFAATFESKDENTFEEELRVNAGV
jgi:hypothetical protein